MARDNFTPSTKSALARNVHFRCVYPGCPLVTHASTPDGDNINVGNAAHISAASPGGPRFDDELTPQQRRAYDNGAWLCATHANLVDADPARFPGEELKNWQRKMESSARDAIYGAPLAANFVFSEICSKLELFLKACRKISLSIYNDPKYLHIPRECVRAMEDLIRECPSNYWRPVHAWHSLHPTTHAIQVRAVDATRRIVKEVTDYTKWSGDQHGYVIIGAANVWSLSPTEDINRISQSFGVVREAYIEYCECLDHLNEYAAGRRHPGNVI